MTAIPSTIPAKLPVFDTLLEAFSLWGRNFLYFAPIAAVFVTVITFFPIDEVPDLITGITNSETRLLYLGHMALVVLLTYALYWLVSWRCFQCLRNPDKKEAGAWFPKEFLRFNSALLILVIITEIVYPTVEVYIYDVWVDVFLKVDSSGAILSEYPVVLDIAIQAPYHIFCILFFILIPLTVIEKTSFIGALKRTLELSKSNYIAILGLFLLNFVVAAIFGAVIWAFFAFLAEFPDLFNLLAVKSKFFVQIFVPFVQWSLLLVFTVALWTATYARLLVMKEVDLTQD
ncbi:hypothetical protein WH96_05235 [Kiloniella spongiae]|uniref:Glycerophosphoryl diester phosphodiesterase membrane domain-containing protein n=1 Tax=Kiloniella spongiae TaxID=1489064 RepID=A0A0H2MYC0_9PROT|nr:hypothetical protein [Kiloniella spongiae]KLN61720.1 hypothetical protein WH96_05235 [Kiloniella spongiae]